MNKVKVSLTSLAMLLFLLLAACSQVTPEAETQPELSTAQSSNTAYQRIYYFHRGNRSKGIFYGAKDALPYRFSSYRGLNQPLETDKRPTAVFFEDQLWVFYKGRRSDKIFYRTSSDGIDWSGERSIGGAETKQPLAPVIFNNRIYLYFNDARTGGISTVWYSSGRWRTGSDGKGQRITSGVVGNVIPVGLSATVFGGQIRLGYIKYLGTPSIYIISSSNGSDFSAPVYTGQASVSQGGTALASYKGRLYVAYSEFGTGNLRVISTANGVTYTAPISVIVDGKQARTDDHPGIVNDGFRLIIVYKGASSRSLYQARYYGASPPRDGSWYGNEKIEGESIAGPSLVRTTW